MILIEVDDDATLAFASMLCYLTARVKARQALIPPNPISSISDTDEHLTTPYFSKQCLPL
ncbi:hypothetical protein C2W62_06205 [Candidatus Entotheonella serta]|nr:hypothetical protein C2W62_06205 [Candidatus Entotheonella serta]